MINFQKHTIRLGAGDVNVSVLESPSGAPVLAFYNSVEGFFPAASVFMGFDSGESIDDMISVLRTIRRSYYPEPVRPVLSDTQRFQID